VRYIQILDIFFTVPTSKYRYKNGNDEFRKILHKIGEVDWLPQDGPEPGRQAVGKNRFGNSNVPEETETFLVIEISAIAFEGWPICMDRGGMAENY
jgi:hypothetical protein